MGRPDAHASPFFQYISNTCRANALAHLPIYFQYLQGLAPIPNINPCRDGKPSLSWSLPTCHALFATVPVSLVGLSPSPISPAFPQAGQATAGTQHVGRGHDPSLRRTAFRKRAQEFAAHQPSPAGLAVTRWRPALCALFLYAASSRWIA
jgi:hypothetical protein